MRPFTKTLLASAGIGILILTGCAPQGGNPEDSPSASASSTTAPEWSYEGNNDPAHWGEIAEECRDRPEARESPIDIDLRTLTPSSSAPVAVSYVPTSFSVENNGHTIEAMPADLHADSIEIDGTTYYLQQFHFHATSEHLINGASAAAELHLVNKSDDGKIAVVSLLIQPGAANGPLAEMFSQLPPSVTPEGDEIALAQPIDLAALLPADLTSVRYDGSLTTPPCSEGVEWNVVLAPVTFSPEQLAALTALYPDNHRPTQPLNDREVELVPAGV